MAKTTTLKELLAHMKAASAQGATTHPTEDADDGTIDTPDPEALAAAENKKLNGPGGEMSTVAKTKAALHKASASDPAAAVDDPTLSVNQTGDTPEEETASVGFVNKDPGTTHPARTDNGEKSAQTKYAFDATMSVDELLSRCKTAADTLCVTLITEVEKTASAAKALVAATTAAPTTAAPTTTTPPAKTAGATTPATDAPLGYSAADVDNYITHVIKQASYDADLVIGYYQEVMKKQANDPAMMPPEGAAPADPAAGGGAPAPSEEEILAMLSTQGDPAAGGDPMAGGAMPPAEGDSMAGGGDISPEEIMQLLAAAGITPEQLEAAMAAEGGAAPPKTAQAKPAKTANTKTAAKAVIDELIKRSRGGK